VDEKSYAFNGAFYGNGKTVDGLYIYTDKGFAGLFGYLGAAGSISRLTLEGSLATSTFQDAVGGLVGFNRGKIDHYTGHVVVYAPLAYNVGGVVGFNDGRVETGGRVSGNGAVEYSANDSSVRGYSKVGGIAGQNAGLIKSCANTGKVNGSNASSKNGVGGIAGRNGNNNTPVEEGIILDSFAICEVGRDGGQKWVGGITGFQNLISRVENCYFAGSFPSWNNNSNNPIAGYTDYTYTTDLMNLNNYSLDTLSYSSPTRTDGTVSPGEIGIRRTAAQMQAAAFLAELNGTDGIGRAYIQDFAGSGAVNGGYPILRGVQQEDTAVPVDAAVFRDPTENYDGDLGMYSYIAGQHFDTTGFVAVVNYSDGTTEKVWDVEVSPARMLQVGDTSVTLTARYGSLSVSKSYPVAIEKNDLTGIEITAQPNVTIYASGERFNEDGLVVRAHFETAVMDHNLEVGEYTCEPQVVRQDTTAVTITYAFNGIVKTAVVPVTGLSERPLQLPDSSYPLSTADHLVWFAARINQAGGSGGAYNAVLQDDIDLTAADPAVAALFAPIGTPSGTSTGFSGVFDGGGHSVTLNYISDKNYIGLFGKVQAGGVVKGVTVKGTIEGAQYVGGIAGDLFGRIENCVNEASVTGVAQAGPATGGLAGYANTGAVLLNVRNQGSIRGVSNCGGIVGNLMGGAQLDGAQNTGSVAATVASGTTGFAMGGIAGRLADTAAITNAENAGTISGNFYTGGIVGQFTEAGTISKVKNTGTVSAGTTGTALAYGVGGLVGVLSATGSVTQGVNLGAVNGDVMRTGGVVGYIAAAGSVTKCYNGGIVTGKKATNNNSIGGIAGAVNSASSTVNECYNTGKVTYAPASGSYTSYVGPVVGRYLPASGPSADYIAGDYYAAGTATAGSGVTVGSIGTAVSASNVSAATALLASIIDDGDGDAATNLWDLRIRMSPTGYPVLANAPEPGSGDADGDGAVTMSDVLLVLGVVLSDAAPAGNYYPEAADMDGDGTVTMADVLAIMTKVLRG
jgi:hypothetical protein